MAAKAGPFAAFIMFHKLFSYYYQIQPENMCLDQGNSIFIFEAIFHTSFFGRWFDADFYEITARITEAATQKSH